MTSIKQETVELVVFELFFGSYSAKEIAKETGVSLEMVYNILTELVSIQSEKEKVQW